MLIFSFLNIFSVNFFFFFGGQALDKHIRVSKIINQNRFSCSEKILVVVKNKKIITVVLSKMYDNIINFQYHLAM